MFKILDIMEKNFPFEIAQNMNASFSFVTTFLKPTVIVYLLTYIPSYLPTNLPPSLLLFLTYMCLPISLPNSLPP